MKAAVLVAILGLIAAPPPARLSPASGTVDLGARWTTKLTYRGPAPKLTAVRGTQSRAFAVTRVRKGVYRASVAPDAIGRWTVKARVAGKTLRLGTFTVRPALTNAVDV